MIDPKVTAKLVEGFANFGWGHLVMILVGGILIYLAIVKEYEPVLLLPIGIGCILANIPVTGMTEVEGLFGVLYAMGIKNELFPLLIFIGVGAMTDFGPLLERPYTVILGAAAQFGIFGTLLMAHPPRVQHQPGGLHRHHRLRRRTDLHLRGLHPGARPAGAHRRGGLLLHVPGAHHPAAHHAGAHHAGRAGHRDALHRASRSRRRLKVLFPIVTTLVCGLIAPMSTPLIGMLMFGNLLREAGVVERLSNAAQNELINVVTIFLGLTIGSTMSADKFLTAQTLFILGMGLVAFALDTVAGLGFGKLLCLISRGKVNPLIGASGISAFPMSARVVNRVGLEANPNNFLLMHAMGSNTAGQIGSVMAGGAILALLAR